MADSVNDRLLSSTIQHAIDLQHFNNGAVRRLIAVLNRSNTAIAAELAASLQRLPAESFTVERLDSILASVEHINKAAYAKLANDLAAEARALTDYELGYQHSLFESLLPQSVLVDLPLGVVNANQVYAAAMARPFQGRLLREWAATQDAASMQRIRDVVRIGYVEQSPVGAIVSKVRGTRAAKFEDGAMAIDRRAAEALVRTALSHTAGFARDRFMAAQGDLVAEVQWVSVLDARTSSPCILRDGQLYENESHKPVGHSYGWGAGPGRFHWNCRSTSVPVVKSFAELGIPIGEFSASTRASMDGQVPGNLSYGEWLRRQSASRQDSVLGPTRGALFRAGDLPIEKFANDKGRWLSIEELKARDSAAFEKAGL